MSDYNKIKSVAIIGAGAAGAVTAAAFKAEDYYDRIRVFERRETPGGTWIYDPNPSIPPIQPGGLPADIDRPLDIPTNLPTTAPPSQQERYSHTPIYDNLTLVELPTFRMESLTESRTNVPDIAMSFSDIRFSYGPFVPHYVPRQYIENYFSLHKTDEFLSLNTTVEDVSQLPLSPGASLKRWKLTLRKYEPLRGVDVWWEEEFDAVIIANGHYSIPWVPVVTGLEAYMEKFPGRVVHSKFYRSPHLYTNKKVLIIGNSTSGHDVTVDLLQAVHLPVYQSRRSKSRWDGDGAPPGVEWKPIIKEYRLDGTIVFEDDTTLSDIDQIIYCTGYRPSYPWWNSKVNGRPLFDYKANKLIKTYWHTFFQDFANLALVGLPRVLTFRSFEYQAVALARLYSGRNAIPLPPLEEQQRWEREREEKVKIERRKFHEIGIPPALTKELVWAIEHLKKYPEPGKGREKKEVEGGDLGADEWVLVEEPVKDLLAFI
ncbi:hypothetical protein MRS44_016351 [Fusarium solani]|uniref:uncharacterized protein n=1 Tax=Fusarium solani TaxID=169388 RepID=UPI0032C3E305|nr:hypothetical protein MRS44_016351 [Fusarium solani]